MNTLPDPVALMLAQARRARLLSPPNPSVGAVAVSAGGAILAEGHTQQRGGPHAEVMMLRDAAARGADLRGATVYVSLEPCSHHGRTGPCCDALIEAGVGKVVASLTDPNPLVAGQGFARLRAAGIAVDVGPGAVASRELNLGFFSRMVRGTPWVRVKSAASLDGVTALADGTSQWITSPQARADGHAWRARACAVLTGIGTVRRDDPVLDARLADTPRQPHAVVIDTRLETPVDARLLGVPGRQVHIYGVVDDPARRAALQARGATVTVMPAADGRVDLGQVLRDLARREINEVHVEAGAGINGALLDAGLVDEVLAYLAPKLLGRGMGMTAMTPPRRLDQAVALDVLSCEHTGADIRIHARLAGRSEF